MIKISKIDADHIAIHTPYNAAFVDDLKRSISSRKWDGESKTWTVFASDRQAVEQLLEKHFSYAPDAEMVTVELTALKDMVGDTDSVRFCGTPIASARGRDSGARVADGVTLLEGKISSGGSRARWETIVRAGARFRVRNVPSSALASPSTEWAVTRIDDDPAPPNREALQAERTKLLARLAEIDKELAE